MAVQTIHLADQPNLFRYKRGEKVVQRGADGYPDPDWVGIVVDGTWRGDPSGGAYKATYRVKRAQGDSFDADELTLLKRFDTDAELRDEIREKINTYALPRSMLSARPSDLEIVRLAGGVSTCSACGHPIRLSEPGSVKYQFSWGMFRFHSRCHAIWQEEAPRQRFARPSSF